MRHVATLVALATVALAAGCDDPQLVKCGSGTLEQDGSCIPDTLALCGEGTKKVGDKCVPVSTLTCAPGTVENAGRCEPGAKLTCGAGTEERDGVCTILDPLRRVTIPEGLEPNTPPGAMTNFTLPELDAAPVVLGGVVSPPTADVPDVDGFAFLATRGQRLRIKAIAIGSPTAAFVLQPTRTDLAFDRFAIALDVREAERDILIPADGKWAIYVSDQSNLTGGLPMGGTTFTYTVDVSQVVQPEPKAANLSALNTGDFRALDQLSVVVDDRNPLYDIALEAEPTPGFPGQRALWATGPDGALLLNEVDEVFSGYLFPMSPFRLALPKGTTTFTIDYVYAIGAPPPYSFNLRPVAVHELGAVATPFGERGSLAADGNEIYVLDASGNTVISAEFTPLVGAQITPKLELRDAKFELVATINGNKLSRFIETAKAGRYYFVAADRSFLTSDTALGYDIKVTATPALTLGPVAAGDTSTKQVTLPASGVQYVAIFAGNDERLTVKATPAVSDDAELAVFPLDLKQAIRTSNGGAAGIVEIADDLLLQSGGLVVARLTAPAGAIVKLDAIAAETDTRFEREANDDALHANLVELDSSDSAQIAGDVETSSSYDFFRFVVVSAPTTHLVAETHFGIRGGATDTQLALLTSAGATLLTHNDVTPGGTSPESRLSRITADLAPGTYYLRVARGTTVAPWDSTDYRLTINR